MEKINALFYQSFSTLEITESLKLDLIRAFRQSKPEEALKHHIKNRLFVLAQQKPGQESMKWLSEAMEIVYSRYTPEETCEVKFSPGIACLEAIIEEIRYATKSIDICVFTISDNRIADAIEYAHSKGVKVRIITDNDKSYDLGSDVEKLAKTGISVKIDSSPQHMHHKFALFDNKKVLTGSFNWTRSATDQNAENILITNNNKAIERYQREFERLWHQYKTI